VLDLSLVEDSVASLFPQGEEERGVTVTYREATDGRGETLYSVDVDVPNDLDIDLDLEVDFPEAAGAYCSFVHIPPPVPPPSPLHPLEVDFPEAAGGSCSFIDPTLPPPLRFLSPPPLR